jgi:hypothetical protein
MRSVLAAVIVAASCCAFLPGTARADATGPTIQSVWVTPNAVDTDASPQQVTVNATITDDSGVSYGYIVFTGPSGYTIGTYLYQSAPGSNVWAGTVNVPQWLQGGDWHVSYLYACDVVGSCTTYATASDVSAAGLDAPITVTSAPDLLPPDIQSDSVSPSSVDITNNSVSATFSATITDDVSGVAWAYAGYASPSSNRTLSVWLAPSAPGSNVWTGTLTLPRWAETGAWHPYYIYAGDRFGHVTSLYGAAIANAGLDAVLTATGSQDLTPPAFHSVSVNPSAVDDGARAATVNVSATVTDDVSGVGSATVGFSSPSGAVTWAQLTPSAPGSNVWVGTLWIPQLAQAGTWHVYAMYATDHAGNSVWLSGSDAAAAGLDAPITVTTTIPLPVDHFKVRVAPSSVAAGGAVSITITAQDSINQTVTPYVGPVTLTDASGTLSVGSVIWTNGVGTASATVPGPYHADTIGVADGSGIPAAPAGTSNTFNVIGPVNHLSIRLSSSTISAGGSLTATLTALDALNQTVPWFSAPVALSDLSGSMTIVAPLAWSNGVGTATVSVANAYHADSLSGTSSGVPTAASPTFNVVGPLDHFVVRVSPTSISTGASVTATVTPQDTLNQTIVGYAGPVTLGDLSGSMSVASLVWAASGVGTATVSVVNAYHADKVTVSTASGAAGSSNTFNVIGSLDHFLVRVSPSTVSYASPLTVTITALDALNQTVAGYTGPVTLTDLSGSLTVTSSSWNAGVGTASVTVANAYHADAVSVGDASGASGMSNTFNVTGPATHFVVTVSPTSVLVRGTVDVTVTALDALNQKASGFTGSPLSLTDVSGYMIVITSATWSGGVGQASIEVTVPYHADRVSVYDWWSGLSGTSNTFNVV